VYRLKITLQLKSGMPLQGRELFDSLQIEHILGQKPKNDVLTSEFKDFDDYYNMVYKLGNVTLLESTINQAVNNFNDLENDWFAKKQNEYAKSNVTSTNLLNDEFSIGKNTALNRFKSNTSFVFKTWNKDSIKKRQEILLDLVFDTWKVNDKRIDK
jgi:methanogenic corrinoid protein MtbC1